MLVSGCSGSPPQSSPHPGANPPVAVPLPAEPCPNPVGARGAACTSPCCRGNYRGGTTGVKCLPGAGRGSCACAPGLLEHARAAPAAPHPWSSLLQLPSCTLHQLVSRLALLCLARLLPPPSSHVLLYVPSPAACLQPSGSRGAGSPQWGGGGGSASAGCSAIHRWVLCQPPRSTCIQRSPCLLQLWHSHGGVQLTSVHGAAVPGCLGITATGRGSRLVCTP